MFEILDEKITQFIPQLNPWLLVTVTVLLTLYAFWKGCTRSRKNNSSVFDTFFVSVIFGAISGRILHIINNWHEYESYIWYWLPYEKYGDEIFLFRLLPWRFLKIWDLGVDVLYLFLGYILVSSLFVLFVKKWKWSHLFPAIFLSAFTLLALSFFSIGDIMKNSRWIIQGVIMLLILLIYSIVRKVLTKKLIGAKETRALLLLEIATVAISSIVIFSIYLSSEMMTSEKVGMIIFAIWVICALFFHMMDTKRATVIIEKVSSVRHISIPRINPPINSSKPK